MTARSFAGQAQGLQEWVGSKVRQLEEVRALTGKLQKVLPECERLLRVHAQEIQTDVERLVQLSRRIGAAIDRVEQNEYRALLTLRYLCGWTWERIAQEMDYSYRNIQYMHKKALGLLSEQIGEERARG